MSRSNEVSAAEHCTPNRAPLGGFHFNRMELAGSLGDLGVLLPLGIGMVLINGLDPWPSFWPSACSTFFPGFISG